LNLIILGEKVIKPWNPFAPSASKALINPQRHPLGAQMENATLLLVKNVLELICYQLQKILVV
jgi:hypothetical protein